MNYKCLWSFHITPSGRQRAEETKCSFHFPPLPFSTAATSGREVFKASEKRKSTASFPKQWYLPMAQATLKVLQRNCATSHTKLGCISAALHRYDQCTQIQQREKACERRLKKNYSKAATYKWHCYFSHVSVKTPASFTGLSNFSALLKQKGTYSPGGIFPQWKTMKDLQKLDKTL